MLKFSDTQQRVIKANRAAFNARQAAMHGGMGHNSQGLIGNALPIPYNVWGEWDKEGVTIQRKVMAVFNDLAASLSRPLPIGKLIHYFQIVGDNSQTNISLDGRSKSRADQPTYNYAGTPLPIFDNAFSFGWREVEAAQSEGFSLEAAARTNAMFKTAESLEQMAILGVSKIVVGGNQLYGLTNHPKRNTRSTGVTLTSATGVQWVTEMNATIALLIAKNFTSKVTVYMNYSDWRYAQVTDYSAATPFAGTIATRIKLDSLIDTVVPSMYVPANTIIAVVKDRNVLQILSAMPMNNRAQFRANPEDDYTFITMAAAAIEIKYDATNQCGIAVSS